MKIVALLTLSVLLFAKEDMLNLLDDLNDASQISTKTKLNINKTPAIVSILHADELQKFGITSVYEALETVPGIEISMGIAGAKQINMRGNKSLVTDKLKFMVDGISINAELSGANHFYLNMPIENIERIEIIRGPASALYGSFAHIGVINVITKASTHKKGILFLRGSSEGSNNIGFTQHVNNENIKVALSGSFQSNDNSREYEYSYPGLASGPYTSYEDFTSTSFGVNIELYKDFSFDSKYLTLDMQNYFGYGAWPIVQDPKNLVHTSWVNELEYAPRITENLSLDLKAGYKEYGMVGKSRTTPYSALIANSHDLIADGDYHEATLYTDLLLNYNYNAHNLTVGTYLAQTKVKTTSYKLNTTTFPVTPTSPINSDNAIYPISGGGLVDNIKRKQYAFYFSDVITLSEKWMANVGLRYDHYSDVDSACSPKLSLLYAHDDKQTYKLIYQNSFRAPTFIETYGTEQPFKVDSELNSETIDTFEFAYRYENGFNSWINLNFFYSKMKDFIFRDSDLILKNGPDASSYGAELEFKFPIYSSTTLQANYSYVHSEDENNQKTPMIANHLANVLISYQISKDWHTGTHIRYVGERSREEGDLRDPLKAYTSFDQTLSYTYKDFLIQASVKNIFDQEIVYSESMGDNLSSGTYVNDLERDGRVFWLNAQWKFK